MAKRASLPARIIRATAAAWRAAQTYQVVDGRNSFWGVIRESYTGAWQENVEVRTEDILHHPAVQACLALISGDIAKLKLRLMQRTTEGIWQPIQRPQNPIFNKPNHFQTRIQFIEQWVLCLLIWGNVYVLKRRDATGKIIGFYILNPEMVSVLVSPDGQVFYQLASDNLADIPDINVVVPAEEIIHDRYKPKYHPLVGNPPVAACALAAAQGMAIQNNATAFFRNGSRPGGIITAPGPMTAEKARELKERWNENYTGANAGKVAVLADGLRYEPQAITASDAQATEQLKLTNEMVGMAFLVPLWKIGAGPMPAYGNVQSAQVDYYSTCLQTLIENIEALIDDGIELEDGLAAEFDVRGLLRMDSVTQMEVLDKAKSIMTPNEQRRELDLPGKSGGDAVYRQQQDFSIEALSKRDDREDPFAKSETANDNSVTRTVLEPDDLGMIARAALSEALANQ